MKTGIITAYSLLDYGNRLQNFAMHTVLAGLGLECETLVPKQPGKSQYRRKRERHVRMIYERDPVEAQTKSPGITRHLRFEEFERNFMQVRQLDAVNFSPNLAKDYRWIVTGGDGVWHPTLRHNLGKMDNHLLAFAKSGQRVCMAPSLAGAEIPEHMLELYHAQWNKFPWLNVRTQEDAQLIREITGREAEIMLDPILLVDPVRWEELIRPLPEFDAQEPYCLFLGGDPAHLPPEAGAFLEEMFADGQYRNCCLGSSADPVVGSAGPAEFLYLLKHAGCMVTDSYYGAVFAVLLGRPFIYVGNSRDSGAEARQVREVLALLDVSWQSAGDSIWSAGVPGRTAAQQPEGVHSLELLKKMFHLETPKSEEEVGHR